jgi:hypothetical protein
MIIGADLSLLEGVVQLMTFILFIAVLCVNLLVKLPELLNVVRSSSFTTKFSVFLSFFFPFFFLFFFLKHSYSASAAYCAALPGVTGVADSGHRADVDPCYPILSPKRDHLSLKPAVFHQLLSKYACWPI